MNITKHRNRLSSYVDTIAKPFDRLNLTPNQVTLLSLLFAFISACLYYKKEIHLAPIFLLLSSILDLVDGSLARMAGKETKFGAAIDWIADKYVDCSVIIGISLGGFVSPVIALFALFGSMMNTFIKPVVYAEIGFGEREKGKIMDPLEGVGIFGRPETIIVILVASVLNIFLPSALFYGILIIAVMTNLSALERIFYLYKRFGRSLP